MMLIGKGAKMRPALRYYGSKWKMASFIISQMPNHLCYVEPFGGSAAVLLQKTPAKFEVFNDLDGDVVNFFKVLRETPRRLIRAIQLTPYSRAEWLAAAARCAHPVERARRFYVRSWQSFSASTARASSGWRYMVGRGENSRADAVRSFNQTDHLWQIALRLKAVQIESDDALSVMARYDAERTLFYVDPPYLQSTRGAGVGKGYAHEMSLDDHSRLLDALNDVKGMVILSGYDNELYTRILPGWGRINRNARDLHGGAQTEVLWVSPRTQDALLPLFAR